MNQNLSKNDLRQLIIVTRHTLIRSNKMISTLKLDHKVCKTVHTAVFDLTPPALSCQFYIIRVEYRNDEWALICSSQSIEPIFTYTTGGNETRDKCAPLALNKI